MNSDKLIQDVLQHLGLNAKERRFFLSCFKIGPASIPEITQHARIERSTAYLIAKKLIGLDLIEEDLKSYGKKLIAAEPKKLLRILSAKQRTIQRKELELEERLSEIESLYQATDARPKVRVFEGNNGLLSVWGDILEKEQEILLWSNQETESLFFTPSLHEKFITERKRKNILIRVLAVNNFKSKTLKSLDLKNLRETKLLPENVNFSAETYIYGDKIAIIDYKKDIIGIIIQSEPIAKTQRAIFEMTWNSLE